MKKTGFIPRLESLRGIAALTVVGYHVNNQLSAGAASGWLDALVSRVIGACANGTGAVVTFFVLSGFVLARSLDSNSDPVRFLRNRLFRLLPINFGRPLGKGRAPDAIGESGRMAKTPTNSDAIRTELDVYSR